MGAETIINILMKRDGFTREEAKKEFKFVKHEFYEALAGRSYFDPEEVLYEYLGLEPDYIECFL